MNRNLLKAKIVEKGYNLGEFAKAMKMSHSSFSYKINGKKEFRYSEILRAINILNLSSQDVVDIFFSSESIQSVHLL